MRIPFMWFSINQIKNFPKRLDVIGHKIISVFPGIKYDIILISDIEAERYVVGALVSSLIWAIVFLVFAFIVLTSRGYDILFSSAISILTGSFIGFVFFVYYLIYPNAMAKKIGEEIDEELVFVLKDMLIQLNSGIPIYNVLKNLSQSHYKYVNDYFKKVILKTNQGKPLTNALLEMSTATKSVYLKKLAWGLIVGLRRGGNISKIVEKIHDDLVIKRIERINVYAGELQFISLMYLLFGAIIPSLGITLLFLFSVFKLINVTESLIIEFIIISFVIQAILVGYIYIKRPKGM